MLPSPFAFVYASVALACASVQAAVLVDARQAAPTAAALQQAIDGLDVSRSYIATVKAVGVFTLESTLRLPDRTRLDLSEAVLIRGAELDGSVIENTHPDSGNTQIEIIGGRIDGNKGTGVKGKHGIALLWTSHAKVQGVTVVNCHEDGVRLNGLGKRVQYAFFDQLHLANNGQCGLNIMWASRQVLVSNIVAVGNGVFGVRSDHSEGSYVNIAADRNQGDGIFIRNIFGGSYTNLTATRNGKTGILVQGMVQSLGANWAARNNGTAAPASDIFFSSDASLSYGLTAHTVLTGVAAGNFKQYGPATSRQPVEFEGGREGFVGLQLHGVQTGETAAAPVAP
jgi:hypothetical protein